jgi:hypothetical protein
MKVPSLQPSSSCADEQLSSKGKKLNQAQGAGFLAISNKNQSEFFIFLFFCCTASA